MEGGGPLSLPELGQLHGVVKLKNHKQISYIVLYLGSVLCHTL